MYSLESELIQRQIKDRRSWKLLNIDALCMHFYLNRNSVPVTLTYMHYNRLDHVCESHIRSVVCFLLFWIEISQELLNF